MSLAQLLPESVDNGVLRVAQVAGRSTLLNARASDPVKYLIPQQRGEAVVAGTQHFHEAADAFTEGRGAKAVHGHVE